MQNFSLYLPTKVFFGDDAESHISEVIGKGGYQKVLIHYGSERVRKNGLLDKVIAEVEKAGAAYVLLGGVTANPKVELSRQGVELCRQEGVDFLLGVGGGSVSDSCKAIRLGVSLNMDPWEAVTKNICPEKPIHMGLVLTMSAAGSEMSNSCVMTNAELGLKRGCNHDGNRPEYAFMNPANTLTTPAYQTAAGVTDIMMHTMERFLTNQPETPLTDAISLAILNTVKEFGPVAVEEPDDLEARSEIMWASTVSHNNLTECGRGAKTFTCHKIEHDLSGEHDNITHGAGLAVVFPAWCLFEYRYGLDRFFKLMVELWDAEAELTDGMTEEEYKEQTILDGIGKMKAFFASIGMPVTMGELGIDPSEYEHLSGLTTNGGANTLASFRGPITREDIMEIYRLAE